MSAEPWSKSDLLFLEKALRRGMSVEYIAGFLRRTVDEVQAMAWELQASRKSPAERRNG